MKVNEYGHQVHNIDDLIECMFNEQSIDSLDVEPSEELLQYMQLCDEYSKDCNIQFYEEPSESITEYHAKLTKVWNIPEEYKNLDILERISEFIKTEKQYERIVFEYEILEKNNYLMIIRSVVYITDMFRKHGIVWGVGRGSSVASYILYLLGVHSVDSLKYELDFSEFIR